MRKYKENLLSLSMNILRFLLVFLTAFLGCEKQRNIDVKYSLMCDERLEELVEDPFKANELIDDGNILSRWVASDLLNELDDDHKNYLNNELYSEKTTRLNRVPFGGGVKLLILLDSKEQPVLAILKYREDDCYRISTDIVNDDKISSLFFR